MLAYLLWERSLPGYGWSFNVRLCQPIVKAFGSFGIGGDIRLFTSRALRDEEIWPAVGLRLYFVHLRVLATLNLR